MATSDVSEITSQNKGKMIAMEPEITSISELNSTDYNKTIEVIVYHKWVSNHIRTRQLTNFYCMLIDKQGHAIQVNMDVKNTDYFDQLLRLHKACRISDFGCEKIDAWEKTIDNNTSLIFGKLIHIQEISNIGFPEHYFNFAAYNELAPRANQFQDCSPHRLYRLYPRSW